MTSTTRTTIGKNMSDGNSIETGDNTNNSSIDSTEDVNIGL